MSLQKVFSLFAILVMLSSMLTVWPEERQRHPEMMQEHSDRMSEEQEMLSEREQERIYGWQIMTPEERLEHRNKMRSFRTREEREAYRREHHEKMQARARDQSVTLPDLPG